MQLIELEILRQKIVKKLEILGLIFAVLALFSIVVLHKINTSIITSIALVGAFGVMMYGFLKKSIIKDYRIKFKKIVIFDIIKKLGFELTYHQDGFMRLNEFVMTGIYTDSLDGYSGNDLISGDINGTKVKFSDIHATKNVKIGKKTEQVTIFCGIFFVAEFNKNIKGITYILDKKSNGSRHVGERAYMDNSIFESTFRVYTTDQIIARYLLTPKFMQDFLRLKDIFKCPINACLIGKSIYIYIERGFDSFEPNLKEPVAGKGKNLEIYKDEIVMFVDIVKILNLNNNLFK